MLSMDVFLVVVIMVGGHEAVKEGGGKTRPPGLNCKVGEQPDLGDLRSDGKKRKVNEIEERREKGGSLTLCCWSLRSSTVEFLLE